MTASQISEPTHRYKQWQQAVLGLVVPAAYGAILLATHAERVTAAFLGDAPVAAIVQFFVLLLYVLLRYGLFGAVTGWLRRQGFWAASGAGSVVGIALFFISSLFLRPSLSFQLILSMVIETVVLALVTSLFAQWIQRFIFRYAAVIGGLMVLALLAPVALVNDYRIGVVTEAYYLAIMASSWALLAGIGGQFSFAHLAFVAIGTYTSGLLGRDFGVPPLPGIIAGTLAAGLVGLIIGVLCLPLRRAYLALFTIAFSEILRIVILTEFQYTEGSNGLQLKRLFPVGGYGDYYVILLMMVVSLILMYALTNSRFGMFWRAIREDQEAVASLGVDVVRYKVLLFVITSMIAGMAGATFFHTITIITPTNMELLIMSTVIAMAVMGSIEILAGAAIGAFVLHISLEMLREIMLPGWALTTLSGIGLTVPERIPFGTWRFVLFGLLLMLTLRFARNGLLWPLFQRLGGAQRAREASVAQRQIPTESETVETEAAQ